MIKRTLEDFGMSDPIEDVSYQEMQLGQLVRNANYHMMKDDVGPQQQLVLSCIHAHPDGICDKHIAMETGLPLASVCGRRNELIAMGFVAPMGITDIPDYKGRMRPNTLWGPVYK